MYNLNPLVFVRVVDDLSLTTKFNSVTNNHIYPQIILWQKKLVQFIETRQFCCLKNGNTMAISYFLVLLRAFRQKEGDFNIRKFGWLNGQLSVYGGKPSFSGSPLRSQNGDLEFVGAMNWIMFMRWVHIRCHQEPCQSGMVYPTNVLKILKKRVHWSNKCP